MVIAHYILTFFLELVELLSHEDRLLSDKCGRMWICSPSVPFIHVCFCTSLTGDGFGVRWMKTRQKLCTVQVYLIKEFDKFT